MRNIQKRFLALALAGAMVLPLCACGDKAAEGSGETAQNGNSDSALLSQELGYGYLSQYRSLHAELDWINSNNISTAQGKLYFSGDSYDEENEVNITRLYCADPETGETTEIPVPELTNEEGISEYVQSLTVCPDASGYWMVIDRYTYTPYEEGVEDTEIDTYGEAYAEPAEAAAVEADGLSAVKTGLTVDLLTDVVPLEPEANETAPTPAVDPGSEIPEEVPAPDPNEEVGAPAEEPTDEETAEEDPLAEGSDVERIDLDDSDYTEENQNTFYARKCDMNGSILTEIDLTEAVKGEEYFYPQYTVQNGEGDLLIAGDSAIYRIGPDGETEEPIDLGENWIDNMVVTEDGTVAVTYYDGKMVLCRVEENGLSDPVEVTGYNMDMGGSIYSGSGNTLLLSDGKVLYSLDLATGEATKLLSWLDSDINGGNLAGVAARGEDKILVLMREYSYNSGDTAYELGILTKTPAEQLPQRIILTLGAQYLNETDQSALIDFNRKSDTYRITMIDYSQYNTEDDYNAGATQLDRDVITGNCPDIICLTNGHADKYLSKGVLADLAAIIEKDDSIDLNDLLSGPLQAYTVDGKLYGIPTSFNVQTMLASARLVGDKDSWTMAEMSQIIEALDEEVSVTAYYAQDSFLSSMVSVGMPQFVDYAAASCSFDSDEFRQLLSAAAKLPAQDELNASIEAMEDSGIYMDEYNLLQSGECLLTTEYISGDSYSLKQHFNVYTRENGFVSIGYPTAQGSGALISVNNGFGISAKCQYPDGAWEFLKTLLSDENQMDNWAIPVTVSAFDQKMAEAMEQSYYMEEGEKVYYDDTAYIGDTEYPMEPLTETQAAAFKDLVNGASIAGTYDEDILDIVTEEAGACFAGDKTAEEVSKLIQNRVTIYLGETS